MLHNQPLQPALKRAPELGIMTMMDSDLAINAHYGNISVEGATLSYLVEGSGIPVMVIGSSVYYPKTFSSNFRNSYRLAYADMRHFSVIEESSSSDKITLRTYLADIEQIREAIEFDRFVLVGHSHHGNLALEYTKQFPERVSHLVLIGTPPCNVQQTIAEGERYWDQQASQSRKAILARNNTSLYSSNHASIGEADAFVRQYAADGPKYWYNPNFDALPLWQGVPVSMEALGVFREFFVDYEFSCDPTRLNVPVLAVIGMHDYAVPHTLWNDTLRNLQGLTYCLLDKSGHTPQLEEPGRFDQIVKDWLEHEGDVDSG